MLIYSSSITFEPHGGTNQVIDLIANWATKRTKSYVDGHRLATGTTDLRLIDGSILTSKATLDDQSQQVYPYFFSAQLSHSDNKVSGRRWVMEVGLRHSAPQAPVDCTFLLRTQEVSARVTDPVQVTRPLIVQDLVNSCNPVLTTPGLKVKRLDEESAQAFLAEIEYNERHYPIVLMSSFENDHYLVTPERIRSLLVGLADVVEIPAGVDTFKLEKSIGRRFSSWGGAINIIFPARQLTKERYCHTVLFLAAELRDWEAAGKSIDSEILAAVTHRTNLPCSWQHISPDVVSQAILRRQLGNAILRAKQNSDTSEYVALLEEADNELKIKTDEISELQINLQEKSDEVGKLQSDIDGLKHAIHGRRQSSSSPSEENLDIINPLRESITLALSHEPNLTLEQSLNLISILFPDRVVILDSAWISAQESDSGGFRRKTKAFELLWKFVTGYWEALDKGVGDQHAKQLFGHDGFAQNEGQALSNAGKRRRAFTYRNQEFIMRKHLKIGVKDSLSDTLRVHFEWVATEQKLVVGHCGKHLDF